MSDHSPHTNELSQPAGGCPLDCAAGRPVPERCAVLLATLLQYAKYPATPNSTRWVSFILPDDLAEYVLGHLISERASLDGFLALGNERTRAERLDRWIEALTPNVADNRP